MFSMCVSSKFVAVKSPLKKNYHLYIVNGLRNSVGIKWIETKSVFKLAVCFGKRDEENIKLLKLGKIINGIQYLVMLYFVCRCINFYDSIAI